MLQLVTLPAAFGMRNVSPFCLKVEMLLTSLGLPFDMSEETDPRKAPKGKLPYLLADGQLPSDEGTAPAFSNVPFGADTGVLKIQPGVTYDAFVTPAGSTEAAITIADFTPVNGQVLEVIARDAFGEETLPQALIIDYDGVEDCVVGAN